jgi:hypothetical protein
MDLLRGEDFDVAAVATGMALELRGRVRWQSPYFLAREKIPDRTFNTLLRVRGVIGRPRWTRLASCAWKASTATTVISSIGCSPNAGTRWTSMIER